MKGKTNIFLNFWQKRENSIALILLILISLATRFWGLSWALPYNPHPDEWNMAVAITRFNWPKNWDPKFYAYGQFPLYLTYFSAYIFNFLTGKGNTSVNISEATFFLRFWSATASVGIVILVYLIINYLTGDKRKSFIGGFLTIFTPGLIQAAHFGTTEALITFFFFWIIYLSFKITETKKLKFFILTGIIWGLAVATKITALFWGVPLILSFIFVLIQKFKKNKVNFFLSLLGKISFFLIISVFFCLLGSPFLVLGFNETKGVLLYEINVARGKIPVFYTRQFFETLPIVFQFEKIFPFALGWLLFLGGILGFFVCLFSSLKFKEKKLKIFIHPYRLILVVSFSVYLLYQSFLFCKWTRFMTPLFPFFPIFGVLITEYFKKKNYWLIFLILPTMIQGILFFSIYLMPDVRLSASEWIYENIPDKSIILSDSGNVLDLPLSTKKTAKINKTFKVISFDFYHLDENTELLESLAQYLEESNFIIIPSRRVFKNHLRLPLQYPLTSAYYKLLFSGQLGFKEIAKMETLYTRIFKDEEAEETFTVFDHPTIRIYQKVLFLSKNDYEKILLSTK